MIFSKLTAVVFVLALSSSALAQTAGKSTMTLAGAKKVIAAAVAAAAAKKAPGGAIAVVDDGGNLIAVERLDRTFAASANISIGKARTAALFKRPTKVFEDVINQGRTAMATLPDFTPLQGGVPINVDGEIVGAVGVSGAASAQQDEELAMAGANALTGVKISADVTTGNIAAAKTVTFLPAPQVKDAFKQGMPLLEVDDYKVHASHREAPGSIEVHSRDTDIIYVLEGNATLVTGGAVVEGKTIEADEIRGKEVIGGEARPIAKGDVIVIPHGTPHWFKEVSGPINYYVVKVRSGN